MNTLENNYNLIERNFVDYIISIAGPNKESDEKRQSNLSIIKQIIVNGFNEPDIIVHIFSFGSFPFKDYHKDSDIDVTVVLEDKTSHKLITMNTNDFLNRILTIIENSLRNYFSQSGSDEYIERIDADVRLIKCKFEGVSFDISINNFSGLFKIIFMHNLETKYLDRYFYKKTLVLIKTWCYYQGCILGSNIGLLGSYALEILVLYMFNNYGGTFNNEIEAFFTFFDLISKVNWENQVLTIYGLFDNNQLANYGLNLENLFKEYKFSDKQIIKYNEISEFVKQFERFNNIEKVQNFNVNKKALFIGKYNMYIIDPIFNSNNLAKSVNLHNYSRIKELFLYMSNKCNELIKGKISGILNPNEYLNSLLELFSNILIKNNSTLFRLNLPGPKIVILPQKQQTKTSSTTDSMKKEDDNILLNMNNKYTNNNYYPQNKESVIRNSNRISSMMWPSNTEIQEEQCLLDYYHENIAKVDYITPEINEFFNKNTINISNPDYKKYEFITNEEVKEIEEFEKNSII